SLADFSSVAAASSALVFLTFGLLAAADLAPAFFARAASSFFVSSRSSPLRGASPVRVEGLAGFFAADLLVDFRAAGFLAVFVLVIILLLVNLDGRAAIVRRREPPAATRRRRRVSAYRLGTLK